MADILQGRINAALGLPRPPLPRQHTWDQIGGLLPGQRWPTWTPVPGTLLGGPTAQ